MSTALPRSLSYEPVDSLRPAPRNPKEHALEDLTRSVTEFGFTMPVMVDERTGRLAAGHGRTQVVKALRDAGEPAPDGVVVLEELEVSAVVDVLPYVDWRSLVDLR